MAKIDLSARARCIELIRSGLPSNQIKQRTGLSDSTIRFIAFKAGLPLMTLWGPSRSTYWQKRTAKPEPVEPKETNSYVGIKAGLRWD